MSHTNTTPNFNLPQFVGTDKPAWLTDINQAFLNVDTAIKTAKDSADTATGSATTANTSIGTLTNLNTTEKSNLVGAINEINTNVGIAQNTANGASTTATATDNRLTAFEKKFNVMHSITTGQIPATGNANTAVVRLAQDSTSSMFKFYGARYFFSNSVIQYSAVAGMANTYGADTGLILTTPPTQAYIVENSGMRIQIDNSDTNVRSMAPIHFAVGTNGHIYVNPKGDASNITIPNGVFEEYIYSPYLYFNTSFGDEPQE